LLGEALDVPSGREADNLEPVAVGVDNLQRAPTD
jgi:hypothetical protein